MVDSRENYKFDLGVKGLTLLISEKYTSFSKQVMIIFKLLREEFL